MKKRRSQKTIHIYRYTLIDVMMASPNQTLPTAHKHHQLTRMHQGLEALEKAPAPSTEDWRVVSDAVNLMETLITNGPWPDCNGDLVEISDNENLLQDAITALALAGKRHRAGGPIRLDGLGIQAARAILEDYADLMEVLPARTMIKAHRETERRIHEILIGKKRPHDIEVMEL